MYKITVFSFNRLPPSPASNPGFPVSCVFEPVGFAIETFPASGRFFDRLPAVPGSSSSDSIPTPPFSPLCIASRSLSLAVLSARRCRPSFSSEGLRASFVSAPNSLI